MLRELVIQLKEHEGVRLKPYICTAGKLTIGVGRNLDDVGISLQESECMLFNDINRCEFELREIFKEYEHFSEIRKIALIDMMFNLGKTRFLGFRKMIQAIKECDWEEAGEQAQDSKWYSQVGSRAEIVVKQLRRGI